MQPNLEIIDEKNSEDCQIGLGLWPIISKLDSMLSYYMLIILYCEVCLGVQVNI